MNTIVYGVPLSPFVRKVLLTLDRKKIDYTNIPVTPMEPPEDFLAFSPLGKIPALRDDQLAISDSSVICEYLEDRYPDPPVYPHNPVEHARARWIEEYCDTKLAEVTGPPLFFERVIKRLLLEHEPDEERVQRNLNETLPPVLTYLESQVPDDHFFNGGLSVADFAVGSNLLNARHAGFQPDAQLYPRLSAYLERLFQHPLFAARIAADAKFLGE